MQKKQWDEMQCSLKKLIDEKILYQKNVIIFGSNEPAEKIMHFLDASGFSIDYFIDNNSKKQGQIINEKEIRKPDDIELLSTEKKNQLVVLIASKYFEEMQIQLVQMGIFEQQIYQVINMDSDRDYSLSDQMFESKCQQVIRGQLIYDRLNLKEKSYLFICPYSALGDVYLVGMYLEIYCNRNRIEDYLLTVVGGACKKVGMLFDIVKIEVLSQADSDDLIEFVNFSGVSSLNCKILHQRFPYFEKLGNMGNYRKINFHDIYKYGIFNLPKECKAKKPSKKYPEKEIEELFIKNNLPKGKTIIVSPYANTVTSVENCYWEEIVQDYTRRGYRVCTNSIGSDEPAIDGTIPLCIPLMGMIQAVEYAGTFIGLRSGLCDVISTAKAEKIIIYPQRIYQHGTIHEYYSLNVMGLCSDAKEIIL
ncbi:MAG: hypothetical protein PHY47_07410 [Lachnospiraceae bacterium]|nr:hypothetical protein [Lachnospiraceae bacterium]